MKKIISAAAAAALLIGAVPIISATAADVTSCQFVLTPDKSVVHPNETVTYTFSIIPNGDVYALQAFLELPDGFSLVEGSGKLIDGVKEQLKWDDIAVTESDKLLFSGFTAQNPYTNASELKIATFECKADSVPKNAAPSLSSFYVLNSSIDEPSELTTSFLPVTIPGVKKVEAKASTCTEQGNNEYYVCDDNCGRAYKDSERKVATTVEAETLPLAHKFVTENITAEYLKSEANCQNPAEYYKRCIYCGAKSEETFALGEADPDKHVGGKATCIKKAVCELCGKEYGEIDPSNHGSIDLKNASAATETSEGYTGDKYCVDCDTLIEKGSVIPKLDPTTPPDDPKPDTPSNPSTPDTPSTPSTPDTPTTPTTPDKTKGSVTMNIKQGEHITEINVITSLDTLESIMLTDDEQKLLRSGTDVRFILAVEDTSDLISAKDKAVIEEKLKALEKYSLAQYFNMTLIKLVGALSDTVKTLDSPITVSFKIPQTLLAADREFAMLRVHNGEAKLITDMDDDSDTITFKADRFSAYALIYGSKAEIDSDVPYTGVEEQLHIIVIAGIALLLCVVLFFTTGRYGLSEERKERTFSRLIAWGKKGGRLRSIIALGLISLLLVYYYGIGMKSSDAHK